VGRSVTRHREAGQNASGKADDMTGSEQIDGLQATVADRKNRWSLPARNKRADQGAADQRRGHGQGRGGNRLRPGRPGAYPVAAPPRSGLSHAAPATGRRKPRRAGPRLTTTRPQSRWYVRARGPQHLPTQPEPLSAAIWPTATARRCGRFPCDRRDDRLSVGHRAHRPASHHRK
jgi:hypothetical protein